MRRKRATQISNASLPFSNGSLSVRLWQKGSRVIVGVPELDLLCSGKSQPEATFRLFSTLLKYYQQLKSYPSFANSRQAEHKRLLKDWVTSITEKMRQQELVLAGPSTRKSWDH